MSAITQIESSIETLPRKEFFALLGWMADRHLELLSSDDFEDPELETAMLKSIDSSRHPVNEVLFEGIRTLSRQSAK